MHTYYAVGPVGFMRNAFQRRVLAVDPAATFEEQEGGLKVTASIPLEQRIGPATLAHASDV